MEQTFMACYPRAKLEFYGYTGMTMEMESDKCGDFLKGDVEENCML